MRWAAVASVAVMAVACGTNDGLPGDVGDTRMEIAEVGEVEVSEVEISEVETSEVETSDGTCGAPGGDMARFDQTPSRFTAMLGDGYRIFSGAYYAGTDPGFHSEVEREGQCRLLTFTPSLCEPSCEFGDFCIEGTCTPRPASSDLGPLTLSGLARGAVNVSFDAFYGYSWQSEDNTFEVTEVGLAGAGFALESCAPVPFVPIGDWNAQLEARADAADVTLRWSDPVAGARIYIRMTTGIGTHGGISPVEVECEGPDTGALTLPGRFLDALFADGWGCGECGINELERYFAAETDLDAHTIQLRASTETWFYFHP